GSGTAGGSQAFYAGGPVTNFATRWSAMISITQPGPTTFATQTDDGSRLFVDNILVVANDGSHGVQSLSGTINLGVGLHDLRVDYAQGGGGDQAQVSYGPAGGVLVPIPFNVLYTPDPLTLGNALTVSGNSTLQLS